MTVVRQLHLCPILLRKSINFCLQESFHKFVERLIYHNLFVDVYVILIAFIILDVKESRTH